MLARRNPRSLVLPPAVLWPLPQAKMKRTTEVSTWKPTAVALGWPVAIGVSVAFAVVYSGTCGPPKSFAFSPATIPPKLEKALRKDVLGSGHGADGCNQCAEPSWLPVWLASGDLCEMQASGQLVDFPKFQHCVPGERDFEASHHVKACLPEEDLNWLWKSNHCWKEDKDGIRLPNVAKEGLLFCQPSAAGDAASATQPSSPSADRQAYDSCLVDLDEARKEYKECAAKAAQVFTPKTKKELEDAVNEWCRNPGQSCSKFGDISEWDVSMGCDAMFGRRSEHVDASVGCLMQRSANRCKRQRASATSQERSCREVQKCLCAELALALARNRSG